MCLSSSGKLRRIAASLDCDKWCANCICIARWPVSNVLSGENSRLPCHSVFSGQQLVRMDRLQRVRSAKCLGLRACLRHHVRREFSGTGHLLPYRNQMKIDLDVCQKLSTTFHEIPKSIFCLCFSVHSHNERADSGFERHSWCSHFHRRKQAGSERRQRCAKERGKDQSDTNWTSLLWCSDATLSPGHCKETPHPL